jgi:hypothetical protein
MARAKIVPSRKDIRTIESLAKRGAVLDDIADVLGWSPATLDRRIDDDPDVAAAYRRGRAGARVAMSGRLWDIAMQEDDLRSSTVAAIFWLKCQAGWSEHLEPEVAAADQVHIYLPENGRSVLGVS